MKLISWNVNGLRACISKDFLTEFDKLDADFFCLQETKLSAGQLQLDLPGYYQYWNYAEKKGYSGTAIFTKHEPISVAYGIGVPALDTEGRVITLEYPEFYLVTCYTPNAQRGLARLEHRMAWDDAFRDYLKKLDTVRPVIICGDLNVAHQEIDLKNPKSNRGNAGFSDEERESFQKTLDMGFTDTFRHLHPDATGRYSWWSYMYHARENNAGWRIDYFLVSDRLKDSVYRADIHDKIMGSDHCPVELQIDTLVNGGIWSSERRGKSSVVSPAEKNKKENTKAGAENAKAFAAFFLVCAVLAGICLFAKGNGESQGANSGKIADPFEVSVSYDPMQQIVKYTSIFDSTENYDPYYSDRLTDGENTYYFYYFDEATLEGANVWLKIALTDVGLEYYSKDWTLQLEPLTLKLTNADSADQLTDFENISIAKYYTDTPYSEDPDSRLAGWMIWGHLPQDGQFRINLLDGQQVIYSFPIDLLCQSGDDSQIIEIGNVFDAAVYYTPLTEYMYIQDASPSASNLRCVFFDGNAEFYVDWTYEPLVVDDADYWIRVDLTDEGLQLLDEMNFEFSASPSDSQDSIWSSTLFVTCTREFYTDERRTQLAGWFVYGTLPQAQSGWMNLSVSNGELDLHRESVHIIPYITAEEAADMTTEDLVEYIIDHPGIQEALLLQTIVSTILDDEYYAHVVSAYPVLTELKTREDAVQCVMDWSESLDTTTKRIPDALLEYVL